MFLEHLQVWNSEADIKAESIMMAKVKKIPLQHKMLLFRKLAMFMEFEAYNNILYKGTQKFTPLFGAPIYNGQKKSRSYHTQQE